MSDPLNAENPENYEHTVISFKTFQKYSSSYGGDRARGYNDALRDVYNNIEGLFYDYCEGEYFLNKSPNSIRTRLVNFRGELQVLINQIEEFEGTKVNPDNHEEPLPR